MPFVIIGVVVIALNLLGIGPPAAWNWQFFGDLWKFTVPFIAAALWWLWSDKSGLNKRREMARMDAKKYKRRQDNLATLGLQGAIGRKNGADRGARAAPLNSDRRTGRAPRRGSRSRR